MNEKNEILVPVSQKYLMTVDEAGAYFNIGVNRIREMEKEQATRKCFLRNGVKLLVKRKKLEEYLDGLMSL